MYGGRNYNHSSHHHHHHYPNDHIKGGGTSPAEAASAALSPESALASDIFEQFIAASTFKSVLHHYRHMCDVLRLRPQNIRHFYPKFKNKIRSWKAQALWTKFDKRAAHKCYNHGKACTNTKLLIIGSGPCGLRTAIEAQLLGAKVVVVEKRDRFSRNNVLHLWPFVIADLKALGAKKFYGKFCAGAIDHISIRQLQCILLKVALLLGVEVFEGVTFEELLEPPEDQSQKIGWHARFSPPEHPVNQYEFDVLIGADGKRNTLLGFRRKEFRGKLAIAITANFINRHSEQEARVQEISGVAFIFNQKFFKDLYAATGIDLENIVYYKDETHYFVMTAKKHSLIDKGVILRDLPDTQQLLHPNNVDRVALSAYAREAADFSTGYQMPHLDFAVNHYGKPDIAMFDFTSMFAAENACRAVEVRGHKLLQCLVGDSLLEPFWPTGSGCARGFSSSFDAAWAVRSWSCTQTTPLEVIAERESIYRLLAQTTPENLSKDYSSYTLEPSSRYPTINLKVLLPFQVRHLFITDEPDAADLKVPDGLLEKTPASLEDLPRKRKRRDSLIQPDTLLSWFQKQVANNETLTIENLSSSFKDGRALCMILHRYRPDLLDMDSISSANPTQNCQLAFDIIEREFGIPPIMTGNQLANAMAEEIPDLIAYLSQIHDALRGEIPHSMGAKPPLKVLKGRSLEGLDLEDFPHQPRGGNDRLYLDSNLSNSASISSPRNGRLSCRILEEPKPLTVSEEDLKHHKRSSESESMDKLDEEPEDKPLLPKQRGFNDQVEDFNDRIKGLEAKFKGECDGTLQQKPKDLIRAIGKIEKTDWNLSAIERKIEENPKPAPTTGERERVPKWTRDNYNDKFQNIERRLRENGEDEERIAKYLDIDASLKRLERKLREGSTLETGLRGHNKVSNLANQLSSKLVPKEDDKALKTAAAPKQTRTMVLPTSDSDLCYFCGTRVYLVERLSAEGKFFHRQCFKCSYCGALLRLGNYIYDRENRYGGKFFCIPHFGLTVRARSPKKTESPRKELQSVPFKDTTYGIVGPQLSPSDRAKADTKQSPNLLTPPIKGSSPFDRGTTPERVEFENSVIEASDEEEYLSEDEWTDRNFGASANELDEDEDDSDYSDLSDEEVDEEVLLETSQKLTVDETRRLAESWKRRYSNDVLEMSDDEQASLSESEHDEGDNSEHGAEGDESHTPTEGEIGDDDDDDDDEGDHVRRARELRRQEVNINVGAPPRKAETSESGSETEVGSEDESDTQIDTDSEFADDREAGRVPKEIPTIVIDEMPKEGSREVTLEAVEVPTHQTSTKPAVEETKPSVLIADKKYVSQVIEINPTSQKEGTERSASLSNITQHNGPNPRTEQLKRLLQRTESTEMLSAQRNYLRRQYLLGNTSNAPRKSVSTADIGNKFKSFMDKISETQKKLNPAPQPSPAMQAFLNLSNRSAAAFSPFGTSPKTRIDDKFLSFSKREVSDTIKNGKMAEENHDNRLISDDSDSSSKSEEGKLITFSNRIDAEISQPKDEISNVTKDNLSGGKVEVSPNFNSDEGKQGDSRVLSSSLDGKKELTSVSNSEEDEGEKGSLDSEQPEKKEEEKMPENCPFDDLEKDSTMNFDELGEDTTSIAELIEAFNDNYADKATVEESVEALNMEVIRNENFDIEHAEFLYVDLEEAPSSIKNLKELISDHPKADTSENQHSFQTIAGLIPNRKFEESELFARPESHLHEASKDLEVSDIENLDEIFDRLASDALNELPRSETGSPCFSDSILKEQGFDVQENTIFNQNLTFIDDSYPAPNEKVLDESGFRSMEDNKTFSSELFSNEIPEQTLKGIQEPPLQPTLPVTSGFSPEIEAVTTEADFSDWAEEHDALSFNTREFEVDLMTSQAGPNCSVAFKPKASSARVLVSAEGVGGSTIARIASLESLGDSDSAISVSAPKPASTAITPVADLEPLEYMDTSPCDSSHEEGGSESIRYNPLQDLASTAPSTPNQDLNPVTCSVQSPKEILPLKVGLKSKSLDTEDVLMEAIPRRSYSQPHRLEDQSPLQESSFLDSSLQDSIQESILQESSTQATSSRDSSQLESPLEEPLARVSLLHESSSSSSPSIDTSSKRCDCYIPRFKDRVMPFSLARDSIDVRKSASCKPLFTPSKEDILQREKDEAQRLSALSTTSLQDSSSAGSVSLASLRRRPKDGDLVRDMVMSRIPKKSGEKGRRGSRNALHLSLHSSSSSLFGSEPSLEERTPKESPVMQNEFTKKQNRETKVVNDINCSRLPVEGSNSPLEDLSCKDINSSLEKEVLARKSLANSIEKDTLSWKVVSPALEKVPLSKISTSLYLEKDSIFKKGISTPNEKGSPVRSVLPATPLTHPEKFQKQETVKRELFKSSPQLHSSSSPTNASPQPSFSSSMYSTPSEFSVLHNQNVSLSKSLINTSIESSLSFRPRRLSESEGKGTCTERVKEITLQDAYRVIEDVEKSLKKDPDERLKQLLEERRRREAGECRESLRLRNKDSCLQECLDEYRQKRSSAPVFAQSVLSCTSTSPCKEVIPRGETPHTRSQLGLAPKRHFHRPSLLELESMQVFSSSQAHGPTSVSPIDSTPAVITSTSAGAFDSNATSSPINSASVPTPSQKETGTPEKKPVKKSKDRERRRSLIQVVAGMFKSDDKKKEKEEVSLELKDPTAERKPSSVAGLGNAPRSPVKERFSKLRLSRSKEKKKQAPKDGNDGKNRSVSVDTHAASGAASYSKATKNSISLPTSPSRTIFSFLSSSPVRPHEKSRSSTSSGSSNYFSQRFSPSCIKEENNSEDEVSPGGGTCTGKGSPATLSTPSLRRQRAAVRAAKQAEQKRLRMAQEIQRQLEECEVKTRELEERGISVEKSLIGETEGPPRDEAELMKEWFGLVHEKNALIRWQEELTIKARELELEDRHLRLENELRQRMTSSEREKTRADIEREGKILAEIISIIEQKDALVNLLEEDRQRFGSDSCCCSDGGGRCVTRVPHHTRTDSATPMEKQSPMWTESPESTTFEAFAREPRYTLTPLTGGGMRPGGAVTQSPD